MCAMFIVVIAGFISRRVGLVDEDFQRKLSNFVIQLTCPALIISSTMGNVMPDRTLIPTLLLVSVITYVVLISLAYILPWIMHVRRDLWGMYRFMLTYSNVGFIGYPVVASIFGQEAVFYASILNVANTFTVFIWGVMFISGESFKSGFNWKLLYSPSMLSTYISIILVCIGWQAPKAISLPLTLLGNMTVPASLIVIGSAMAGIPAKKMIGTPHIFMMSALKLVILPIMMYHIVVALNLDAYVAAINMYLIAMPVASFGTMFCVQMGKDETTMSQGTFWTTLLAVGSIPLLSLLV